MQEYSQEGIRPSCFARCQRRRGREGECGDIPHKGRPYSPRAWPGDSSYGRGDPCGRPGSLSPRLCGTLHTRSETDVPKNSASVSLIAEIYFWVLIFRRVPRRDSYISLYSPSIVSSCGLSCSGCPVPPPKSGLAPSVASPAPGR